jgi:transcriptional regulator with XRE-family HTH domain
MRENLRAIRLRVGRNVQRLRRLRGLTQEGLAELAGNTWKHIGQVERGEVNVGLDILSRIATALSADVGDLFVVPPGGRRSQPPLFLISQRELDQIEQAVRRVRPARPTRSTRSNE